jgi:branched-chain amino acid transport system substrate-binding protein
MRGYCVLATCLLLLAGCNADYEAMAERRLEYARMNQGDIIIAAIQDSDQSNYIKGAILAVEEINQHNGGLPGRNLKLHIEQGSNDFESAKSTIRRIAANPKVSAVLGHRRSKVAIPASIIYEKSQILFLSPFALSERLTSHGFEYVFRMLPDNNFMTAQMSSIAETLGYKKIAVLYARDDYSREFSFLFEEAAIRRGLKLVFHASFFGTEVNFRPLISDLRNADFDAVFLSAEASTAATMVKQLREMGIDTPILGSDRLNSDEFKTLAGLTGNKTIVPTLYNTQANNTLNQTFVTHYQNKYLELPDADAAQGYDSVMLFAKTATKARSTLPALLASTLRFMPPWIGVTGLHHYNKEGDIQGKKYFFQALNNGEWHLLPAVHRPFFMEQLEQYLNKKKTGDKHKITPYSQAFSAKPYGDDYKKLLLDLAHEILNFKRLGIIYEDTDEGRKIADYDLIMQVAKEKSFSVKNCKIHFSKLDQAAIEKELTACYGRLSLRADTLYLSAYEHINKDLNRKLTSSLDFFKIPAFTIEQGKKIDPGVSLDLKHLQVDLRKPGLANIFKQLLKGISIHELQQRLSSLPDISVNLKSLQEYGIATDKILKLSPDSYINIQPFADKNS